MCYLCLLISFAVIVFYMCLCIFTCLVCISLCSSRCCLPLCVFVCFRLLCFCCICSSLPVLVDCVCVGWFRVIAFIVVILQ